MLHLKLISLGKAWIHVFTLYHIISQILIKVNPDFWKFYFVKLLLGWIKSFAIFGSMRHNSSAPEACAKAVKMTNHTRLWDANLAWYSLRVTHQIFLYSLELGLKIHGFRPTWPCLMIKVLVTEAKFLEPSAYCTLMPCAFIFHAINAFGCFSQSYGPVQTHKA